MVYSLWKISTFLDFFETLFWSKKHSSLSRIPKNDLFWLHLSKNYTCWKLRFVDQNHGLTPLENFDFSTFLKFYFSGLKSILLYPEYQRSFLAWFAHTWCKVRFFYKNYGLTPLENNDFLDLLDTSIFASIQNIKKRSLLTWFAPKTHMVKSWILTQKPLTNRFGKVRFFFSFLKRHFFWSKEHFFFIQNIKKRSFLAWFAQQTHVVTSSTFWQKPWT